MLRIVMPELLPAIDIAVAIEPSDFLGRMAEIGRKSDHFDVEDMRESAGGPDLEITNFRFKKKSPHDGLGFQLIAHKDDPHRISFEVRASDWSPNPPTRSVYCEAAKHLTGELLKVYNKTYGARLRLRIVSNDHHRFTMTKRTASLLGSFTVLANTSSLHPLDWRRFYALVREGRQEIPLGELRVALRQAGFSAEKADYLSELYEHLWAFKRL